MLKRLVEDHDSILGLGVLAGSATIEYVFPPFPGDFVTVLGAILVTGYGWSLPLVLGAVMLGSIVGAWLAFEVGGALARRRTRPRPLIDAVVARFERHGAAFVMVNRFLPGIRGLVFVAAGLARMPRGKVLAFAAISALAWNLLLMAVGAALGANLDRLEAVVRDYTLVVWAVLIAITLVILVVRLRRRRRPAGDTDPK
jgi:membrane protein DedA with SNARE-associated domain